jgi:hypothetical protein
LRDICEHRPTAITIIGLPAAVQLQQRLAEIRSLGTVAELAALLPAKITERVSDELVLRLNSGFNLVLGSGHTKTPVTVAGKTDWSKVLKLRVVAIEADDGGQRRSPAWS